METSAQVFLDQQTDLSVQLNSILKKLGLCRAHRPKKPKKLATNTDLTKQLASRDTRWHLANS